MFKNTEKKNNGINPKGKIICIIIIIVLNFM